MFLNIQSVMIMALPCPHRNLALFRVSRDCFWKPHGVISPCPFTLLPPSHFVCFPRPSQFSSNAPATLANSLAPPSHPVQKLRGVLYWILHCTQLKLSVRLTQYSEVNRKAKYKQGIAIALRTGCFQSSEVLAHGIEQALSSGGGVHGRLTFVTGNWVLVHCGIFLWIEKRD